MGSTASFVMSIIFLWAYALTKDPFYAVLTFFNLINGWGMRLNG